MSRLETSFEALATRGVERGARETFQAAVGQTAVVSLPAAGSWAPRSWAVFAGALVLVLGVGLGIGLLAGLQSPDIAVPTPSLTTPVPNITLPPADDTPLTVPAEAGPSWYTFLPDVHLAWLAREDGGTDLCWRTPSDEGCADDLFWAPDVVIVPSGSQVVVITRPAIGGPLVPDRVTVQLSTGDSSTALLADRDGIALMYARIEPPDGASVISGLALAAQVEEPTADLPGSCKDLPLGTEPTITESGFPMTLSPPSADPGAEVELHIDHPGDLGHGGIGLDAYWQCWNGSQWVDTHLLHLGISSPPGPFSRTEAVARGESWSVLLPSFDVPRTVRVRIPDVDPGSYRIRKVLSYFPTPEGPADGIHGFVMVEVKDGP